jgi:hypothetical protein
MALAEKKKRAVTATQNKLLISNSGFHEKGI